MGASLDGPRLVRSRHMLTLPLEPPLHFVCHSLLGNRRVYDQDALDFIALFDAPATVRQALALGETRGMWVAPSEPALVTDWHERVHAFVVELERARLLVDADGDEDAAVKAEVARRWGGKDAMRAIALGAMEDVFTPVLPRTMADQAGGLTDVSFVLLGWCFTQSVQPVLEELAAQRGWRAQVTVGFHSDLHLMEELKPDVTVLQLSHRMVLAPLLEGYAAASAQERSDRIAAACGVVERSIAEALQRRGNGLLLVQGVASPQSSPLGVREYRDPPGVHAALWALNQAAQAAVAADEGALFVDEDALLANQGKQLLLDDMVSTYSHHGALVADPANPQATDRFTSFAIRDRLALHKILAGAWLDGLDLHRRRGAIRVIAVDLDNTLWPGELGDERFTFDSDDLSLALMYGRHGGLHEALGVLKGRGILLAVASKNSESEVLEKWKVEKVPLVYQAETRDTRHYLGPQDFVSLKINWEPKSRNLQLLVAELGITPGQLCFVDDNPVEREEVRQAMPEVLILGEDMNHVRRVLLTDPRFDVLDISAEARNRTRSTRARLERNAAQATATDHASFLKSLQVRCQVKREEDEARLGRIVELLARTNQFNTTTRRLDAEHLRKLLRRQDADVFTLMVSDRFADHGLVGVAVVDGLELSVFAMSCRVIGLGAEQALLHRVLKAARQRGTVMQAPFVRNSDRNAPAAGLFRTPGFTATADGFAFDFSQAELPPLPAHLGVADE